MKTKFERQVSTVEHVTSCYEEGKVLGDGNFAVVKWCRHRETGREYALKVIDKAKLANKVDMVENEIAIMKQCNHVNIVRLYEEYETQTDIYLVMELVKVLARRRRRRYPRRPRGVGRLSVCLFARALKGKRLELSAPKSVDIVFHGRSSACTDPEVKRSKVKS